jgi:uncharacterized membrane protein SpoIIM required for sporulation
VAIEIRSSYSNLGVTLDEFLTSRESDWRALSEALGAARGRPARLGVDGVLTLDSLYRGTSADLAYARQHYAGDPVVRRLEVLVTTARAAVYGTPVRSGGARAFFVSGYWRRIVALRTPLLVASALLFAATAAGLLWALHDSGAALGLVPGSLHPSASHHFDPGQLGTATSGALATSIFTNNIVVTMLAFAGGLLLGLGTVAALLYNGLLIGVIAGVLGQEGQTERFFVYIVPHGVLELSCILVTAAAGLRMGMAIVAPGRATRGAALRVAAREGVEVVMGTAGFLVIAGLVEGFVTPRGIGLGPALAVGLGLGGAYWALVLVLGHRRARDFAST